MFIAKRNKVDNNKLSNIEILEEGVKYKVK
jgi:hypothetical protein